MLVGNHQTIEKSEMLSKMLRARGVKHEVLNAKFHEKEAQDLWPRPAARGP